MVTIITLVAILAAHFASLAWWTPLAAMAVARLVLLPVTTWLYFLAGMNVARVEGGGRVTVSTDREERRNEPDAANVVKWFLWPEGALANWCLMNLVAIFYFGTRPRWKTEAGLTMLLNRLVREEPLDSWRFDRARSVQRRWLDRYDPRGKHT